MSTTSVSLSAQDLSKLNVEIYCTLSISALLVYDWLLCFGQEIRFIWNWHYQGVTISSLVYALSRYAWLIQSLCTVVTIFPMSDASCRADVWSAIIMVTLGLIASNTFSALRAYALSNRSRWLATIIVLLALPPAVIRAAEQFYLAPMNLPSPFNCSASSSVPLRLSIRWGPIIARVSQLTAELLVVGITWWYTYQSYRIRRGITLGKTVSSLLFYNGSMYFLCLATLYIVNIVLGFRKVVFNLDNFIEPITSILTCRFMLSLRQFDSTIMSVTHSGQGPRLREHMASTVLDFGAQHSNSLPALIASFAHPVHVDAVLSEIDLHALVDDGCEGREMDVVPTLGTRTSHSPG